MAIKLITAQERRNASSMRTTMLILGEYGVGKTSLLYTMDAASTLALDFEGGFKAVSTWTGDSIHIRAWEDAVNIACYIGGPDPAVKKDEDLYSQAHFDFCYSLYGPKGTEQPIQLGKYKTIWFDSISDLTIAAKVRAREKNIIYDQKTFKPKFEQNGDVMIDNRGMFGDIATNIMTLVRHMQHCDNKNIVWVGKIEHVVDEKLKRDSWEPMLEGQRIRKDLPYVVDQVITMGFFDYLDNYGWIHNPGGKGLHRVFVCRRANPWGLPAKERTQGNLDVIEQADLGALIEKINRGVK